MKNFLLLLSFLYLFLNCNKSEKPQISISQDKGVVSEMVAISEKTEANYNMPPPMEEPRISKKIDTISKKIIKNGEMGIQVGNLKTAQTQVAEILKKNNAYTQSENFQNSDTEESLNLVIRVPHKNFDALVNSFSNGIGEVTHKNISTDDVTEEYTDVAIKLANKKIYLEKYREMLKKASTTKDMLEIQENIRNLEDEIDVAEGRLRFIDDRVNYSTLNLNLLKEKPRTSVTSKIGFGSRFVDSVAEGWNSFVNFLLGIVSFWPYLIAIPFIILIWKKWRNRKGRKQD